MPVGGKRKGAGRPKGSTNKRIKRLRSEMRTVALAIRKVIPDSFDGDGHAIMVAIYKDPKMPAELRLDAAKAAARYEKPQLQAIEHTGPDRGPIKIETTTDDDRAKALAVFLAKKQPSVG